MADDKFVHGQLTQVDENGDVTVMLPHTTTDDITGVLSVEKGGTGVTSREEFFSDTLNDAFGITDPDDLYSRILMHDISKSDLDGGYADLNNYKSPGLYYFRVGTIKTSKHPECIVEGKDTPDDFTPMGYLYVISNTTGSYISQFWITVDSNTTYRRNYESGIWRDWDKNVNIPEIRDNNIKIYFGKCTSETGDNNEIKNITTTNEDFTLEKNTIVMIEFTSNNNAENPKINIDDTGEKDIYYKGVTSSSAYFTLNEYHKALTRGIYTFIYDGSFFELTGYINNVTTMSGATETDNGKAGLVPRPNAGDHTKFLRGDGEWVDVIGATGELVASPDVGSASGTLKIEHGGTGATTGGVGLYNLSFHAPTESGLNLDSLINDDDMGYWYFGADYLPTNAPVENVTGYLFVVRGGGSTRKQIWMNQGSKNNHQDIYVRTRGSSEWQPWVKIKNSKTALVGSDVTKQTGWHKVASGSLTGYSNTSLIFAVHDTKSYSSGILVLDIRSTNNVLTCGKFGWLVSDNINFDDYMFNITDNTWTMYYNVQQQYYRNVFEVIEESGTNTINVLYELYSNQTKENETPLGTTSITSTNLTLVNNDSISGIIDVEHGGTGASTTGEALFNLSFKSSFANCDLNDYKNNSDIGYYAVDTAFPNVKNYPINATSGIAFVFPAYTHGSQYVKQFYTELNNNNIYSRQYNANTNAWSTWTNINSGKIAYVGNNASVNIWYKVASGYLDSSTTHVRNSFSFLVIDNARKSSGILHLTIQRLVNTDTLSLLNFDWILAINIDPSNYKIELNGNKWTMYFLCGPNPIQTVFQVINDDSDNYNTDDDNSNFKLFSNINGFTKTPSGYDSEICVIPNTKEIKLGGPLYFKNYTDEGFYWSSGGSYSNTDEGIATGGNIGPFSLEVVKLGEDSCMQIRTFEKTRTQERRFKTSDGIWTKWQKYITTDNIEELVIRPYVYAQELTDVSNASINSLHDKGSYYYNGDPHDTSSSSMYSLEVVDTSETTCMQTKISPATGIEERRFYNNGWSAWTVVNNFIAPYYVASGTSSNYTIAASIGISKLKTGTMIYVRFTKSNDYSATLEITTNGAKRPIYYGGYPVASSIIKANSVVPLIFDNSITSNGAWIIVAHDAYSKFDE